MDTATDFSRLSTEQLARRLKEDELDLDVRVAGELAGRHDSVPALKEAIRYCDVWGPLAAIHAVHVLGMIKTEESFDALVYALVNRQEALGDWLTEDMAGLLAGFGESVLPKLEELAKTHYLDDFARIVCLDAISAIAWKEASLNRRVAAFLENFIETDDDKLVTSHAVCDLADLHLPETLPFIQKAFEDGKVDTDVIGQESAELLAQGKRIGSEAHEETLLRPAGYFTEKNFELMRENDSDDDEDFHKPERINQKVAGKIKIGRNEPCPCGSGKKFKKCHLEKNGQV